MTISTNASPTEWHCTQDHQRWPGCGHCVGCAESMIRVFAAARALHIAAQAHERDHGLAILRLDAQRDELRFMRKEHLHETTRLERRLAKATARINALADELDQQCIRAEAAEADLDALRRQVQYQSGPAR